MLVRRREDEKRGSMRDAAAAGNSIKTTGFIRGVEQGYEGGMIYVRKEGGKDTISSRNGKRELGFIG